MYKIVNNNIISLKYYFLLQIVFEVYSKTNYYFSGTYENVVINVGGGWVASSNQFIAPVAGIYYFSYSAAAAPSTSVWMQLVINWATYVCDNEVYNSNRQGLDFSSRGCLVNLGQYSTVVIKVYASGYSSYGQATFRGFLYSPVQGTQVAWSVHIDSSYFGTGTVTFSKVLVNVGSAWQTSTYSVNIPTTGLYYMEIAGQTNSGPIDMSIILNSSTTLSRVWFALTSTNYITRSRSVLAYLKSGDKLNVYCQSCGLTGEGASGISFQGLLLYQI